MFRRSLSRLLILLSLVMGHTVFGQECPDLLNPLAGSNNVPVDVVISWEEVIGVTGYIISVGTTPGGEQIVSNQPTGSDNFFVPPLGLPESTEIFVTITLFFFDDPDIVCPSQSFTTENVTTVPECTMLVSPLNQETGVGVTTNLNWAYASRATGYRLSIGTTTGGTEILDNQDVGNTLLYSPPADFPPGTEIFVNIVPYNENGPALNCQQESFITGEAGQPPNCTRLISPANGEINVELTPLLEWEPVAGAEGYIVDIGSSPFNNDVLDGGVFFTTSTVVINFEPNTTYFVRITPFNDAGEAQGCIQESFSTILGCGPFFDEETGELITLNPDIDFPDQVGICSNDLPAEITTTDSADGYRWYRAAEGEAEVLLAEGPVLTVNEAGRYRYEAYNTIDSEGTLIECPTSKLFTVTASAQANIERIEKEIVDDLFDVTVVISGPGDYEFALDNMEGPYGESNVFNGLDEGSYTIYVRDRKGCGISQEVFVLAYPPEGFPPYFSPNGDGINDTWQYVPPRRGEALPISRIYIFDRFGKLLAEIGPNSEGWNGNYNNSPLPSEGYWYKAETSDNRVFTGYFSLVR
jgi:gliding motility-associated-like protein